MANKKIMTLILLIVAVMFVASVAMGAATASKEVTIKDKKINIPDGFEEKKTKDLDENTVSKTFENDKGEKLIVSVHKAPGKITKVTLDDGEVEKQINGVNGAFKESKTKFTYATEDQKYLITVRASDLKLIEDFVGMNK